ncbi:MAG TPA: hypothetical protein VEO01_10990 [Pseudonocardiaceae bacterium]|nr:hypothetical protein [Pseudonocardiaceae bacterium]
MSTDPRRASTWWIAPVLGLVGVVVAVAALAAHSLYNQPAATGPGPAVAPPSQASVPGSAAPGPTTVAFASDFAAFPQHGQLLNVIQTYYNAINDKKYDEWLSVVTPTFAGENPRDVFLKAYQSTHDSSIFVYRVDPAPQNGLRALVGFTSMQALADAPTQFPHACIHWQVVLPLTWDGNRKQWEIDTGTTGLTPQRQAC